MTIKFLSLIFIAVLSMQISCSPGLKRQIEKKPAPPLIVKLKLIPRAIKIVAGHTTRFSVMAFDRNDRRVNITADWKLLNSKNAVGTLDSVRGGIVTFTAEVPGTATLEACYGEYKASAEIEVLQNRKKR